MAFYLRKSSKSPTNTWTMSFCIIDPKYEKRTSHDRHSLTGWRLALKEKLHHGHLSPGLQLFFAFFHRAFLRVILDVDVVSSHSLREQACLSACLFFSVSLVVLLKRPSCIQGLLRLGDRWTTLRMWPCVPGPWNVSRAKRVRTEQITCTRPSRKCPFRGR
jgi:hypothetical protein